MPSEFGSTYKRSLRNLRRVGQSEQIVLSAVVGDTISQPQGLPTAWNRATVKSKNL